MGALIGGIIAALLGVWGLVGWWDMFLKGLKAAVPVMLLVGGIIAIAAGISDIKDRLEEKKEKGKEEEKVEKEEVEKEPEEKEVKEEE